MPSNYSPETVMSALWTTQPSGNGFPIENYTTVNGFDLIWSQKYLQSSMNAVTQQIAQIQRDANTSDTEKMFSMQMAMNTWSAISNLRTNMLKTVSDTLKSIARNVA